MLRSRLPALPPPCRPWRLRVALFTLLIAMISATLPAARATPFPTDPVEAFKSVLTDRSKMPRNDKPEGDKEEFEKKMKAALETRETELRAAAAKLVSIDQLARAIALKDSWEKGRLDEQIVEDRDRVIQNELKKRLQTTINTQLTSKDPADQVATLVYLAETAGDARRTNPPNLPVIQLCREQGPLVIQATKGTKPVVVQTALRTLGQIQADPRLAMPVLQEFLQSPDADMRMASADAIQGGAELLSNALRDADTNQSAGARQEFQTNCRFLVGTAKIGLSDSNIAVRDRILDALQIIAAELRDDAKQRGMAGQQEYSPLLGEFQKAVAYLPPFLSDKDPKVRLNAINIIRDLGHARYSLSTPKVPEGPPLRATEKPTWRWKQKPIPEDGAIQLVAYQPPFLEPIRKLSAEELQATLAVLASGLKDKSDEVRLSAAEALATLGDQALPALKDLLGAANDKNEFVRWASLRALGRLEPSEPDQVVPVLAAHLKEKDVDVRKVAAAAIARYGPKATLAVMPLAESITIGDAEYRVQGLRSLEAIGTDASSAIPAIASNVNNTDHDVRLAAVQLLGRFGPLARGQAKAIQKALTDEDPGIRKAAAVALLAIEGK